MGALAPGSAAARTSAQAPFDTSGNFSMQVSGGGDNSQLYVRGGGSFD